MNTGERLDGLRYPKLLSPKGYICEVYSDLHVENLKCCIFHSCIYCCWQQYRRLYFPMIDISLWSGTPCVCMCLCDSDIAWHAGIKHRCCNSVCLTSAAFLLSSHFYMNLFLTNKESLTFETKLHPVFICTEPING